MSEDRRDTSLVRTELRFAPDRLPDFGREMLAADDYFTKHIGVPMLNPKSRLIMLVASNNNTRIKTALMDSVLSYRAFYVMINGLKAQNLISVESFVGDGRTKKFVLGPKFKRLGRKR